MNAVYIRLLFYFVAPMLGMLPGVLYHPDAGQIVIDLEIAAYGVAGSGVLASLVFGIWGKK
jgi:hypothetical protein